MLLGEDEEGKFLDFILPTKNRWHLLEPVFEAHFYDRRTRTLMF